MGPFPEHVVPEIVAALEGRRLPDCATKFRLIDAHEWVLAGDGLTGPPMCFNYKRGGICWSGCRCNGDHGVTSPAEVARAMRFIEEHPELFPAVRGN